MKPAYADRLWDAFRDAYAYRMRGAFKDADGAAAPLRWKKTGRVLVDCDLFDGSFADEEIDRVFATMALAPEQTFLVQTEHAGRMRAYFSDMPDRCTAIQETDELRKAQYRCDCDDDPDGSDAWHAETERFERGVLAVAAMWDGTPLPNVQIAAVVRNQAEADARIPDLLATPAATRVVVYEPTGAVDFDPTGCDICGGPPTWRIGGQPWCTDCDNECGSFRDWLNPEGLDWLIIAGHVGPGAVPCDVAHVRSAVEQCRAVGVPVWVERLGSRPVRCLPTLGSLRGSAPGGSMYDPELVADPYPASHPHGADPAEWPEDLRVRELPEVRT